MGKRPGIILAQKFVSGHSKKAQEYIEYISRKEATRNATFDRYNVVSDIKQDGYVIYMENPEKTTGIFSQSKNHLSLKDKEAIKKKFILAQHNGSPLWQMVFSFDNQFLIDCGLYDRQKNILNASAIQQATREAMAHFLQRENFGDTAVWTAAIHYNTDNIHVHVGLMEVEPTREKMMYRNQLVYRGKVKPKTLGRMKSQFIHSLLNREKELSQLQLLIRERLTREIFKETDNLTLPFIQMELRRLKKELPTDKRLWFYNMNAMKPFRERLNALSLKLMLEKNSGAFAELNTRLNEEEQFYERLYGTGSKEFERYKDYKQNKLDELFTRSGNMILQYLKKEERGQQDTSRFKQTFKSHQTKQAINNLVYNIQGLTQDYISQLAYERDEAMKAYRARYERGY